ncbi:NUAK2 [Symbiodinium natans]|uniref:NUAK2 protein n=1 Tax=Symbiodinium natans TaxID=878477 RepID=A0A812PTN2_9DINO|nr:NUAK2 [Symbiodinium natans]
MQRPCSFVVLCAVCALACVEAVRPEREFARWGESLWHWGHRDDGLETTANSKDSKIQIGSKASDGPEQVESTEPQNSDISEDSDRTETQVENAGTIAENSETEDSGTENSSPPAGASGSPPEDQGNQGSSTSHTEHAEHTEHQAGKADLHASFEELSKSHNKMDTVMKQYKTVADKGEQRAAKFVDSMGSYQTSLTSLREPLRQISSQVTELQTKLVSKLEADEKERMAPLNSLQDELEPSSNASGAAATST